MNKSSQHPKQTVIDCNSFKTYLEDSLEALHPEVFSTYKPSQEKQKEFEKAFSSAASATLELSFEELVVLAYLD